MVNFAISQVKTSKDGGSTVRYSPRTVTFDADVPRSLLTRISHLPPGPRSGLHMCGVKMPFRSPPLQKFVWICQSGEDSFRRSVDRDFLYDRVVGCGCRIHRFCSTYFFKCIRDSLQNISLIVEPIVNDAQWLGVSVAATTRA